MRKYPALWLAAVLLGAVSAVEAGMTMVHLSPLDLQGARIEGLTPLPFDKGLLQGDGLLQSPVLDSAFPFNDLVGSWNAQVPPGASIEMLVQTRQDGRWTKWYRLSRWEQDAPRSFERQEDENGYVDIDTLKLKKKSLSFRYRIIMNSTGTRHVQLHRVAVAYEDTGHKPAASPPFVKGPWVRELKLASRSQMVEQASYRRDICSPTALAMVLEYWDRPQSTAEVAELVKDRSSGMYGNWPLNIAAAAGTGLSGQVARLPSLLELQDEIAAGRPVIVSISYKEGELKGSPIKHTRGHLLVVVGFTKKGDVIVQDPAAKKTSGVRRVYRRREFERAWVRNKRGLAYLLSERFPDVLTVGVPTADVRRVPRPPRKPSVKDEALSTQVLYGERVRALEAKGDWVRIEVLDQPFRGPDGKWGGYPGWMRAEDLRKAELPYRPNAVIRAKRADLRWEDAAGSEEILTLPQGAMLLAEDVNSFTWDVRLVGGRPARAQSSSMRLLDSDTRAHVDRRDILEAAALYLGDIYIWGGSSSLQKQPGWGVDCSGLVHLAYRSVGIAVPRDAADQHARARALKRRSLKPGDLIFLTESARSKIVDHVLLYAGGDGLIESRSSAGKTLRTTFTERFGKPLTRIESGDLIDDLTRRQPVRRRIYFGSFLTGR
ncbi:MAG: C39 family peptidase [Elusimicrobiota bacterium]